MGVSPWTLPAVNARAAPYAGGATPAIHLWGGRALPQMLPLYAYPQGNWEFHFGGPLVTLLNPEPCELGRMDCPGTKLYACSHGSWLGYALRIWFW